MSGNIAPGVFVCGGNYRYQRRRRECVGQCGNPQARIVVSEGSPYYAPIQACVECGDTWTAEEGLGQRPFVRGWRVKAIKRHEEMWAASCVCSVELDADYYPLPCRKHALEKGAGGGC